MHFIKTAIVTGGSSGIGKSICFELVKNGYEVINFDKKRFTSKNIHFYKTNLEKLTSIKKNFLSASKKFKHICVLVNNAAITISNNFKDYSIQDWNKTLLVNLHAPYYLTQLFANMLIKKKRKGINCKYYKYRG